MGAVHADGNDLDVGNCLLNSHQSFCQNCHVSYGFAALLALDWFSVGHAFTVENVAVLP